MIRVATLALFVVAVLATPEDDLIDGTRTFAAKLYREVIRSKPNQNVIFSPITIQTVLGLLASAGVNENDAVIAEIRNGLNLPYGDANRQAAFSSLLESLNKADNDFKVFDATKMYLNRHYTIEPWYQSIAQRVYKSDMEVVDFKNKWSSAQSINQWVAEKTNNKITNFIDANSITPQTRNVLVNTLYLDGKWVKPFAVGNNTIQTFHGIYQQQQVTMMRDERTYEYVEANNARYLRIQLLKAEGDADMVFVLPKQGQVLSTIENNIDQILKPPAFKTCKVQVTLPKFSFNSDIQLKPILENIGVRAIFKGGVQLRGLKYRGHPIVRITDVSQKAIIDIDESGVTASSASKVEIRVDDPPCNAVFTADQPFLFYITVDDAIVYTGRVMQI